MPQSSITKICLKSTYIKFKSNFPGTNGLISVMSWSWAHFTNTIDCWWPMMWGWAFHEQGSMPAAVYRPASIILCMRPVNERQRYNVTSSLIGWVHSEIDPLVWQNNWTLRDANLILNKQFLKSYQWQISWASPVKLPSGECHKTWLMIQIS